MRNLVQINNWEIKKFIRIILTIQLAIVGLVRLDMLGFDIFIMRQIIGFICLTFIPGLLILRIFKLHTIGSIETLLYSVGLSIAFVMFTGFFMNLLYPLIGISKPISILPVVVTITFIILILCAIAYKRGVPGGKPLSQAHSTRWSGLLSPPALFLFLLPVLAVLGARLVYLRQGNVPLLVMISLAALTAVFVAFGKFIPTKLYPLAILAISISLLWQCSLISPDLTGGDIFHEYPYMKLVVNNSIWDSNLYSDVNAMLSIVMLAPIYSLMLSLDIVWVLKMIYPLFFFLVPLALFQAYRKQTGDKIAFLATFFFMSWPSFFNGMVLVARMPIVELFLALSILLFLNKEMTTIKRTFLLIIFAFSIVVSHYGTSYIYMLYLLMALPLLFLWRSTTANGLWEGMVTRLSKLRHRISVVYQRPELTRESRLKSTLTGTYVMLFVAFCLAWYMYVSSGSSFTTAIRIGNHIYHSLITDFFLLEARDPHVMQALGLMSMREREVEWEMARVIQYVTQLFIVAGILGLIANWRRSRFHPEYMAMSLVSTVILAMCIILPHFAERLNMSRFYHIILFFLAPSCILGGIATFRWLSRLFLLHRFRSDHTLLKLVVVSVVVPYFLFTTGFIFELTGATPSSRVLSLYKADWDFFTKPEIYARGWLEKTASDKAEVYCDIYWSLKKQEEPWTFLPQPFPSGDLSQNSYVFLRRWNVIQGKVTASRSQGKRTEYIDLEELALLKGFNYASKIYNSKEAQILYNGGD